MPPAHKLALMTCLLLTPAIAGCTTYRETQPGATATQQLLVSHAAEIAAQKLCQALPERQSVFLDVSRFKGDGADYAQSAIRAACLARGMTLAADAKASSVTVELRLGGLSIDQKDSVLGLPAMTLPVPGTLTAVPIPELSLYSSEYRIGKAEYSAFAYDTKTGAPIAFVGPTGGERDLVERHFLTVFSSGRRLEPAGVVDGK